MQENFDGPVYLRAVFKIKFSELQLCNCQIRPYADKYGSLDVYGENFDDFLLIFKIMPPILDTMSKMAMWTGEISTTSLVTIYRIIPMQAADSCRTDFHKTKSD